MSTCLRVTSNAVIAFFISVSLVTQSFAQVTSEPELEVKSYYGTYKVKNKEAGKPSPSLSDAIIEKWSGPREAKKPYNIAVLFPHLKDPFWVAVNHGVFNQAKKYGVGAELFLAGGYRNLGRQVTQLESILENRAKYDGIIIGAVQFKKSKLEDIYLELSKSGIPIVSVVNDSYTPTINAKSLVSWEELGYQAGKYLVEHTQGKPVSVLVMPGPKGTGWAPDSYNGFKAALKDYPNKIALLPAIWGDTGDKTQRHLLNFILKQKQNIDYLVGNAIAANAMVTRGPKNEPSPKETYHSLHPNIKIISTYIIQDVYDHIVQGNILASSSDLMRQQGQVSVDMMIKLLNGEQPGVAGSGFPFRAGPLVPIISKDNIHDWSYEYLFGERDFEAIYRLDASGATESTDDK